MTRKTIYCKWISWENLREISCLEENSLVDRTMVRTHTNAMNLEVFLKQQKHVSVVRKYCRPTRFNSSFHLSSKMASQNHPGQSWSASPYEVRVERGAEGIRRLGVHWPALCQNLLAYLRRLTPVDPTSTPTKRWLCQKLLVPFETFKDMVKKNQTWGFLKI